MILDFERSCKNRILNQFCVVGVCTSARLLTCLPFYLPSTTCLPTCVRVWAGHGLAVCTPYWVVGYQGGQVTLYGEVWLSTSYLLTCLLTYLPVYLPVYVCEQVTGWQCAPRTGWWGTRVDRWRCMERCGSVHLTYLPACLLTYLSTYLCTCVSRSRAGSVHPVLGGGVPGWTGDAVWRGVAELLQGERDRQLGLLQLRHHPRLVWTARWVITGVSLTWRSLVNPFACTPARSAHFFTILLLLLLFFVVGFFLIQP